jgi:hypothetical protein
MAQFMKNRTFMSKRGNTALEEYAGLADEVGGMPNTSQMVTIAAPCRQPGINAKN